VSAAVDIQKALFQGVVFDPDSGELSERRFDATREALTDWAMPLKGSAGCGFDRGDDRLALGGAGAFGARCRGAVGRPGAGAGVAWPHAAAEDRPPRRALAGALVSEGDAAAGVAFAGGDAGALRQDEASARARPRSLAVPIAPTPGVSHRSS
jgi:hypothetical protein